jgi:hypothetical protein
VQSTLNGHTSQSAVWVANGSRPEDVLFYSPRKKGTGEWALCSRDKAAAWLEARNMWIEGAIVRPRDLPKFFGPRLA